MQSHIWTFVAVAALLLIVANFVFAQARTVEPDRARDMVVEGATLLDVRTRAEYRQRHIKQAVNIPVQELESRLDELPPNTDKIVLYCRSGNRSARAKSLLERHGFEEVYDLGAIGRWPDAGE